jgi:uncharacterized membrane protein (TIGR02234 family)
MTRRWRSLSVVAILVGAAVSLIASTQTWLDVTLQDAGSAPLAVAGASAVALLAPLSLAALALALALSIVGVVLRHVFGALAVVIGVTLAAYSWRIAAEQPVDAVAAIVTESTGLAGLSTVSQLVSTIVATPWPAITVAAALVITAGGVMTLVTARRWQNSGRRYRTDDAAPTGPTGSRPHDAIDSWDDLSRGDDPTA